MKRMTSLQQEIVQRAFKRTGVIEGGPYVIGRRLYLGDSARANMILASAVSEVMMEPFRRGYCQVLRHGRYVHNYLLQARQELLEAEQDY
jgi:hypothetical protein